ncbi:MAG: efflux RND transporter periplasmic adaptor subunit [Planctomycetes bacterium]|nr:efflux RND transporter periplasmic adaptor subunit [Planctomycetota bacterium]
MARLRSSQSGSPASVAEVEPALPLSAELPAPAADWPAPPHPVSGTRRRLTLGQIVGMVLLAALVAGGYGAYRLLTHTGPVVDVQLFTVTRRSFPVILKEKGELKAANTIDVRCELEGRPTIIYLIPEGQWVKEGDLLIEMASDTIDEQLRDGEGKEANALANYEATLKTREILRDENASKVRKAELQLRLAQLDQQKYIEGEQKELEQEAQLAVDKGKMILERETQDYKDAQELFEQGFITRVDLKDAEFSAYAAGLDLAKAKLALEVLNKYTIPMALEEKKSAVHEAEKELDRERKAAEASEAKATADVDAKKSDLDIARDKLAKLKDQKRKTKITAPAPGLVVYARESSYRSESTIETGTQVHERQMLIQLPDTSSMKVEVRVHEAHIERLREGMAALVQVEGFSNRTFTGKVSKIAVVADSQNYWMNPNLREYKTEILLDGKFADLKPNVTARVEIQMAQMNNVLAVPVQSVFAKAGKFYVFLDDKGRVRPIPIKPGLASTDFVEIVSGLEEGRTIRLAVTDEMRLLLPDEGDDNGEDGTEPGAERRARRRPAEAEALNRPASRPAGEADADERPGGTEAGPARGGDEPAERRPAAGEARPRREGAIGPRPERRGAAATREAR